VSRGRASTAPRLRIVVMRGGTSKGVFVRDADLPAAGPGRDTLLLRLMGSPDPMQLDGLGGSHSSTSKVVAVSRSDRPDTDVEYLFAQVGIDQALVDYRGNCGNLTTAVGPYAIDEGLVRVSGPVTPVRLLNRNTGTRIIAHVPIADGRAATSGDCAVAGVPGRGAPVITEYLDPAGAVLGALLPTGRARDIVTVPGLAPVAVSPDARRPAGGRWHRPHRAPQGDRGGDGSAGRRRRGGLGQHHPDGAAAAGRRGLPLTRRTHRDPRTADGGWPTTPVSDLADSPRPADGRRPVPVRPGQGACSRGG
jgi:hypothetical protein